LFNLRLQGYWDIRRLADSIPVCHRPFSLWESTGSKQTLNGLFYIPPIRHMAEVERGEISELFFLSILLKRLRDEYNLFYKNCAYVRRLAD